MRWKLVIITSFLAGLVGFLSWCAFAIGLFGSARALARNDWLLLASAAMPIVLATVGGVFVYRHTARRRRLQAVITALLALMFSVDVYVSAWVLFPDRFYIPKTYEVRHAR